MISSCVDGELSIVLRADFMVCRLSWIEARSALAASCWRVADESEFPVFQTTALRSAQTVRRVEQESTPRLVGRVDVSPGRV